MCCINTVICEGGPSIGEYFSLLKVRDTISVFHYNMVFDHKIFFWYIFAEALIMIWHRSEIVSKIFVSDCRDHECFS